MESLSLFFDYILLQYEVGVMECSNE